MYQCTHFQKFQPQNLQVWNFYQNPDLLAFKFSCLWQKKKKILFQKETSHKRTLLKKIQPAVQKAILIMSVRVNKKHMDLNSLKLYEPFKIKGTMLGKWALGLLT